MSAGARLGVSPFCSDHPRRVNLVHLVSRRNMFRLVGGVAGGAGVLGAAHLAPATAAASRKIKVRLSHSVVKPGDRLTLHVAENLSQAHKIRVRDDQGLVWKRVVRRKRYQVWTAKAKKPGNGRVTVVVKRADGKVFRHRLDYRVSSRVDDTVMVAGPALIGMSSPAHVWNQRVAEVGGGLAARRIFADLAQGPTSQIKLVEEAHAAGMLPVISYKVGGNVAGAVSGAFNAVAEQAAARLASYGRPTAVTFWHEPYGNMSGAQYAAASRQILPAFRRGELRVGPLLNGWLLDNQVDTFESFCPDDLFDLWDWFGIDTYESGTMQNPGHSKPADRIPALASYLRSRGKDLPIGVGEYNGYSAATIAATGAALLGTRNVWFGCLWNATAGKGHALEGERREAFRQTLTAARVARAV